MRHSDYCEKKCVGRTASVQYKLLLLLPCYERNLAYRTCEPSFGCFDPFNLFPAVSEQVDNKWGKLESITSESII